MAFNFEPLYHMMSVPTDIVDQLLKDGIDVTKFMKDTTFMNWFMPLVEASVKIDGAQPSIRMRECIWEDKAKAGTSVHSLCKFMIDHYIEKAKKHNLPIENHETDLDIFENTFPHLWEHPPFTKWEAMVKWLSNLIVGYVNSGRCVKAEHPIRLGIINGRSDMIIDRYINDWKTGEPCEEDIAQICLYSLIVGGFDATLTYTSYADGIVNLDMRKLMKDRLSLCKQIDQHALRLVKLEAIAIAADRQEKQQRLDMDILKIRSESLR